MSGAIATGITTRPILPGTVPEYEEREAARFGHYTWAEWQQLPMRERVDGVAHYRLQRFIELHQSEAVNDVIDRRMRAAQRRGRRMR